MELIIDDRQDKLEISEELIEKIKDIILECLDYEDYDDNYEVSLSFVDNKEIHELNKEYRGIDRATDVLSFPLLVEDEFGVDFGEESLGDIVISLERAFEQSREYNHSFEREVCFLVCHSMFHLLGYDHDTEENTKEMRQKEEYILNKLGITREYVFMKRNKPRQNIIKAFNAASEGVIYTFKHERNMKIHYIIAIVVLLISLFLDLDRVEMMILLLSISLVIVSEMFNTAVENAVDLITNEIHPLAKIAKDVAAGGVLIASLNAVAVGYLIFYDKFMHLSQSVIVSIRKSDPHVTLICIVLVLISVVVVKALTSTGTPLQGGMPSGHAALAFALATSITMIIENPIVSALGYIMAILVAQSRIEGKIHTFWETVAGALLGILVAMLVFQIKIFNFY